LRREFHADWQHLADCQCISPRFPSFHGHIFSHPSRGRYEGKAEGEAEAEAEATEDGCTGDI